MDEDLFDTVVAGFRQATKESKNGTLLQHVQFVPNVAAIRKGLGYSQKEFAAMFGVPIGTLRSWEQGRAFPDAPARSLLRVIERNPLAVQEALAAGPVG